LKRTGYFEEPRALRKAWPAPLVKLGINFIEGLCINYAEGIVEELRIINGEEVPLKWDFGYIARDFNRRVRLLRQPLAVSQ